MPIILDKRVKKKDGVSRYRVIHNYTDANGKRVKIERLVWGRAEAQDVERQLKNEYSNKQAAVSRMRIEELFEKFKEYHVNETRQSTHRVTMQQLNTHVLPTMKDCRLDKLSKDKLMEWKNSISAKNLSIVTKKNIYQAFNSMLNFAVKMDYIPKNPLSALGTFKDSNRFDKPIEKLRYYTSEQFIKYIAVAKNSAETVIDWGYYVFFCIAFFTGARKGEINALKWSDIEGDILHITRSITQKIKGDDVETPPKNPSSVRDIQIPQPLLEVLDEHKKLQQSATHIFTDDFRVCGGERPLRDTTIDKRNRLFAKQAGLPRIKIHDFRHSHVSLLVNEGINIQEIARRLGHSDIKMTLNTYAHLYPREEERAIKILNKIILK